MFMTWAITRQSVITVYLPINLMTRKLLEQKFHPQGLLIYLDDCFSIRSQQDDQPAPHVYWETRSFAYCHFVLY